MQIRRAPSYATSPKCGRVFPFISGSVILRTEGWIIAPAASWRKTEYSKLRPEGPHRFRGGARIPAWFVFQIWRRVEESNLAPCLQGAPAFQADEAAQASVPSIWRRRWHSNPRSPFGLNGFQDRRNQPLCHLSMFWLTYTHKTLCFTMWSAV